jgi:capsular exopolysaccharide synthesis family protein
MNDVPRYASLRDYLGVLRAQRILIVAIAVVFAGAALGYSLSQQSKYRTASSVYFQDETQNENLYLGTAVTPTQTPEQQASKAAATLGRANIAALVRQIMGRSYAPGAASVSPFVTSTTGFLVIQVDSHYPAYAAALANAYAQAQQTVARNDSRTTFGNVAVALSQQLSKVGGQANNPALRTLYADRIARLNFLAQTSDPVVITQRAGVPTTPISPRPVRNALLGLLVGLTLGVLAAFFRDSLDRRLRRSDDIAEQLGWPVVGHVREQALGGVPLPRNGDAAIDEQDLEAFHILRQNLQFLNVDEPPRSVAVTSGLPEEGKSTVALSLAVAATMAGKLTLLVECDLRRPALANRLGVNATPGLTDFLVREAEPVDLLQRVPLGAMTSPNGNVPAESETAQASSSHADPTLVCITAGRSAVHPAELLGSERFRAFVKQVTQAYEIVVFDTPPLLPVADTLEILPNVDAVLVCVRTPKTTREEARAVRETLERVPGRSIGIVVTGVRPGDEYDFGYYSYAYSYSSTGKS